MSKAIRVLIYEGPEEWIRVTFERNYVQGGREVGPGRVITEVMQEFVESKDDKEGVS